MVIDDQILKLKKLYPDKILITYIGKDYSVSEINIKINTIAGLVKSQNIEDLHIGVKLDNPIELLCAIIALNRIDKIPVLYSELTEKINCNNIEIILDNNNIKNSSKKLEIIKKRYNKDDVQVGLFTSGTTGKPKVVELTFYNILSSAYMWKKVIKFAKDEKYFNCLPLYHIGGLSIFFRVLYFEMHMIIGDYKDMLLINSLKKYYISLVPSMLYEILKMNKLHYDKINVAILGGDHLRNQIIDDALHKKISLYVSYGMTETSSGIAGYWASLNSNKNNFVPHQGVDINVDNYNIIIKSPSVMLRYYNQKNTNNKFITSDIGYSENGELHKILRGDSVIITGGEKVNLELIKKYLSEHENIENCEVIGIDDDKWGKMIMAYIYEVCNLNKHDEMYYKLYLKQRLPSYMVPKKIIIVNKKDQIR